MNLLPLIRLLPRSPTPRRQLGRCARPRRSCNELCVRSKKRHIGLRHCADRAGENQRKYRAGSGLFREYRCCTIAARYAANGVFQHNSEAAKSNKILEGRFVRYRQVELEANRCFQPLSHLSAFACKSLARVQSHSAARLLHASKESFLVT